MLEIEMEIHKGVLFIRLIGSLTRKTISKLEQEVTRLVYDNGITNTVFNVEELTQIDLYGIQALLQNYEINLNNQGKTCLCGLKEGKVGNRIKHSNLLNYVQEAKDELSALNMINL